MCELKAEQVNVQRCLIRKLMLYKFELGDNITEEIKKICYAKNEGTVDYITVTKWFKKFSSQEPQQSDNA